MSRSQMCIIPQGPHNEIRRARVLHTRPTRVDDEFDWVLQLRQATPRAVQTGCKHTCAINPRDEVKPVQRHVGLRVDEIPDGPSRVVKPSPRPYSASSREFECQVSGVCEGNLRIYEGRGRERGWRELRNCETTAENIDTA